MELVERLLLNPEVLDKINPSQSRALFKWAAESLLEKSIFTVENWLETAFHLCKQRWGSSLDWLETQPMSKVQTMIEILKNHNEEQEKEAKKSARRKR
jgi:hypothetical protein